MHKKSFINNDVQTFSLSSHETGKNYDTFSQESTAHYEKNMSHCSVCNELSFKFSTD